MELVLYAYLIIIISVSVLAGDKEPEISFTENVDVDGLVSASSSLSFPSFLAVLLTTLVLTHLPAAG